LWSRVLSRLAGQTGSYLCFGNMVTAFSKFDRPLRTLWCGKIARFFSFVMSQTLFFVRR
jgi:hypothetical protein